jgi:hypothetical protein
VHEDGRIHRVIDATIRLMERADLTTEASALHSEPVLSTMDRVRHTTSRDFHRTSIVRGTTGNR